MNRSEVKILVVDDVNAMRVQIRDMLVSLGFTDVKVAQDGAAAVLLFESEAFHLVLSDWHMVPVGGLDILRYIRAYTARKGVPFILVTAEVNKDRVIDAIKSGVDSYLTKPVAADQLERKVLEVLAKKGVTV
jgi:two-component system chemotaxis response regulator CheY